MGDTNKNNTGGDQNQNTGAQNNTQQQQQQQNNIQGGQVQYTQTELDLLLAQKRVAAKNEFLKSIGFDGDEEGLKRTLERVIEEDEKNETELGKAKKELEKVQRELAQVRSEKQAAESKLEALKLGAKPETVDDLVILASAKLPDKGELSTVIKELKKTYPIYFVEENQQGGEQGGDNGTKGRISGEDVNGDGKSGEGDKGGAKGQNGGQTGSNNGGSGGKSLAERLLAGRMAPKESKYFKNK